jgi:hypothetical protein
VLFEMLTGRRAFEGTTVTDTFARILEREPDWAALPRQTPPAVRTLLQHCLRKDPANRLHDTADARIALEDAGQSDRPIAASATLPATRGLWQRVACWPQRSVLPRACWRFSISAMRGRRCRSLSSL